MLPGGQRKLDSREHFLYRQDEACNHRSIFFIDRIKPVITGAFSA